MLIYRVEHIQDREGPYRKGWNYEHHNRDIKNHPTPLTDIYWEEDEDFPLYPYSKWYCGFESLNQLYKWFNKKDIRTLVKLGYVSTIYDIKQELVKIGTYQVVFIRGNAEPISITYLSFKE